MSDALKQHPCWDSFEGPVYADRIKGKLTYRDWEHWEPEDQAVWADKRATYQRLNFGPELS